MTYIRNEFVELCAAHPTFEGLRDYLTSEAGGALVCVEKDTFAIFHYNKRVSDMSRPYVRWSRSVIWDKVANRPVAVAPPKATEVTDELMELVGPLTYQIQDYLEGVTLNIWREVDGSVYVASRTNFGAERGFYSERTFRDMLGDALGAEREVGSLIPEGYSFVSVLLQHPEHRVVERVTEPKVYVLHAGRVEADGSIVVDESVVSGPPAIAGPGEGKTLRQWFTELATSSDWEWQGVVLKDGTGTRWRMRSASYRMVRSLRGKTPRSDERFFELRRAGLVKTYLYYYPEEKSRFWRYETTLRTLTNDLYSAYNAVYKERSLALDLVDKKLQTHVRGLHGRYLGELRPQKRTVTRAVAIEYMNAQPIPRLLFLLNADGAVAPRHAEGATAPLALVDSVFAPEPV